MYHRHITGFSASPLDAIKAIKIPAAIQTGVTAGSALLRLAIALTPLLFGGSHKGIVHKLRRKRRRRQRS